MEQLIIKGATLRDAANLLNEFKQAALLASPTGVLTRKMADRTDKVIGRLARLDHALSSEPIQMILHCPHCGMQHIDRPMYRDVLTGAHSAEPVLVWNNPPHRSHLCIPEDGGCGAIWRPADVPTTGVNSIDTKGAKDSAPKLGQVFSAMIRRPNEASLQEQLDTKALVWDFNEMMLANSDPGATRIDARQRMLKFRAKYWPKL